MSRWQFLDIVKGIELFPTKCPILNIGGVTNLLNYNRSLWIWGAVECRVNKLNIFTLLCYILEMKSRNWTMSVKVVSCVQVLTEWKKKVPQGHTWNVWYFPSKYPIYRLHGRVLWALLDINNFILEYLFSSARPLARGQGSALRSHIAVCKCCCWGRGPDNMFC